MVALLLRRTIFILIPLILAYFTDERALIATPAILLLTAWENDDFKNIQLVFTSIFSKSNYYIFISWITYFCVRFFLINKFGLKAGHTQFPLFEQYNKIGYALYVGLEGFIIPFALVILYLAKERAYVFTGLLLLSYLFVFYFAISVFD
ncbi:MAG: hypothetical protein NTW54_05215, partial [Bacteroidetes bacterium]|nr:hypothetical protein [Bacteroidota bacterium]